MHNERDELILTLTGHIASAYVTNNQVPAPNLPGVILDIAAALHRAIPSYNTAPAVELKPAVPVKKSVQPEYLVCLEDGKKFKSLKRHLRVHYNLSPEQYREKWGLAADYPMVAPAYARTRSELAKTMGLGRKS